MVALMAGIAIMMILSAVAVQKWSDVVRRDAEAEMIFRAEDIVRALKRFQKDQGKLPNELKELGEPGQKGQYFIRHLWKDPLVKGGKWQLLYAAPGGGIFDPSAPAGDMPTQLGQASPNPSGNVPAGIPEIKKNEDGSTEVSGLPIAGVKTSCKDRPFRLYREKEEYHEWAFSIFDQAPQVGAPPAAGAPGTQQPGGNPTGQPGGNPTSNPH
jgi:type II secretory pathway pseudopilin PulG